jgi:hypothetical protein
MGQQLFGADGKQDHAGYERVVSYRVSVARQSPLAIPLVALSAFSPI